MTRLAYAASLGLLVTTTTLDLSTRFQSITESSPRATARSDDDRGSGRLSRRPPLTTWLSFRGSGRIDTDAPSSESSWQSPVAYRGSGRIVEPLIS